MYAKKKWKENLTITPFNLEPNTSTITYTELFREYTLAVYTQLLGRSAQSNQTCNKANLKMELAQ